MEWSRCVAIAIWAAIAPCVAWSQAPDGATYPFPVPPLEAYARFAKAKLGTPKPIPAEDAARLAECWNRRSASPAKPMPPADDAAVTLHLIAAGVPEADRPAYLAKFNELVADARKAVADAANDRDKADRLLRFLHGGVLSKGYEQARTTLAEAFDHCRYNCVSSSEVYFLVGTRLGLKLQPILIPGEPYQSGHAAVDLLDGDVRVQIEPTNPDGFDWPEKVSRPNVRIIGPQPDRGKARDADGFGLAASAASNLGIAAAKDSPPRPADAVRMHAIALALDPTDASAAGNMVAAVSNWGLSEMKAKEHENAVALLEFARAAFGDRPPLDQNLRAAWQGYLDDAFAAGKMGQAVKLTARAAAALPNESRFADAGGWVVRVATIKGAKEGWGAAIAFAEAATKDLAEPAAGAVRDWLPVGRRQWSQECLKNGDAEGSLKVLADALKERPDDAELLRGLAYHAEKALASLDENSGPEAAAAHFKDLLKRFPDADGVRGAGFNQASRAVDKLCRNNEFADALKAAEARAALAGDRLSEVRGQAYDAWGRSLAKDEQWESALDKYAEGVKACPTVARLRNNAIALIDKWASKPMREKDWGEAVRIYELGLKRFPDNDHLKHNRDVCLERRG